MTAFSIIFILIIVSWSFVVAVDIFGGSYRKWVSRKLLTFVDYVQNLIDNYTK